MGCGCNGSGAWEAEGYEPEAPSTQDGSYFWPPQPSVVIDPAQGGPPLPAGTPKWSADTGKSEQA